MLLAGVDVSGRPDTGNYKFMSVVIGTDEKIESITKNLGMKNTHMHNISDQGVRDSIISRVNFDGKQCVAFCYRIELDKIIKRINATRAKNVRKRKIFTTCYYIMWALVQDHVKSFLRKHRCDAHDVVFQCDGDSEAFLKTVGLRPGYKGRAHSLADIVAWANNNKKEPDGVISVDLSGEISRRMTRKMK